MLRGTLVRVREAMVAAGTGDARAVREHGLLWIIEERSEGMELLYWARSLATGEGHLWYLNEIEEAKDAQG